MSSGVWSCVAATLVMAGAGAWYRHQAPARASTDAPPALLTVLPPRSAPPTAGGELAAAQAHLSRARRTEDPREDSYAEAALAPLFADGRDPEPRAWFLRGVLAQRRHDFTSAVADLERAREKDASQPDVHLTLAFVQLAQGRPTHAEQTCAHLLTTAPNYVHDACISASWTRQGAGQRALERLQPWLTSALRDDERAWLTSLAAEAAESVADPRTETYYKKALVLDPGDRFTRAAYADWLLDADRAQEVPTLLANMQEDSDALLLRRALATRDANDLATLRARFAAMAERGDALHLREEIRFRVATGGEPNVMLEMAQRNYAVQAEIWDLRLLLEACARARLRAPCEGALHDSATLTHPRITEARRALEALP